MKLYYSVDVSRNNSSIVARLQPNLKDAGDGLWGGGRASYAASVEVEEAGNGIRVSDPEGNDEVTIYAKGHSMAVPSGSVITESSFGCTTDWSEGAGPDAYLSRLRADIGSLDKKEKK